MRVGVSVIALIAVFAVATAMPTDNYVARFEAFKQKFSRVYESPAEEAKRFRVFTTNMKKAEQMHKANPLALFGVNEFSDVSAEEFKVRHSGEKVFKARMAARNPEAVVTLSKAQELAAQGQAIDWRTKGAVTAVKNQGQCGSCWSFSSTGSIEGQWFLAGNTLTSVSEQELVSCDTVDSGCNGGLMDNAWGWLLSAHAGQIVTEASYPYVSGNGVVPACSMANTVVGSTISGHKDITTTEAAMAAWMYSNGPLSIAVDATSWQTYTGGIMTNCISSQIDHGVLIVGMDLNNSPPYWIIKNSWAASWGEQGYIRVAYGSDQCLITSLPCTSTVSGGTPAPPPGPTTSAPGSPTPAPSGGPSKMFAQEWCTDSGCKNCTTDILPQGTCIPGPSGSSSSFIATCIQNGLLVTNFATGDCSGSGVQTVDPIDQCSVDFASRKFLMNLCNVFEQRVCKDATCTGRTCKIDAIEQNKCIKGNASSFVAQCIDNGLLVTNYASNDCTGQSFQTVDPINECNIVFKRGSAFDFVENLCTYVPPSPSPPPGPTTPPPPPPTTAAPSGGTLTQMDCSDSACSQSCQNYTFALNTCLPLNGGGSATATCNAQGVLLTEYPSTSDCSGASVPDQMATNTCLQTSDGTSFENFCNPGMPKLAQRKPAAKLIRPKNH